MSKRPNILFLISDEHRFDVSGFMGNGVVKTPNLDRLARDAVIFDNAYCPSPICVPGRQSMMAGQYPRECGCERYGQDLAAGYMTFPRLFSQYAYQTAACGKRHHTGYDAHMGFNHVIGYESTITPQMLKDRVEDEFKKYDVPVPTVKWSQAKEIRRAGVGSSNNAWQDRYALEGAKHFVRQHFLDPYYDRERPDQPLLLYYGLIQPHYPYLCDEEKFAYYLRRVTPYLNQTAFDHPFLQRMRVVVGQDVSERELRRATAAYYGMVEQVDENIGELLDCIENAGENLDDWIIVYTSDHGEMLGEHEVWEKQKFFEGSARVPLFIRYPKALAPGHVSQNVNLVDLFATLCDLAGLPVPEGLDSRSLVPLLRGEAWEDETCSQFGGNNLMIKRGHLKYHNYQNDGSELLFDLANDPGELTDCANNPRYGTDMAYFRQARKKYLF